MLGLPGGHDDDIVVLVDRRGRSYHARPGRKPKRDVAAEDRISFRVTRTERAELDAAAKENDVSVTDLVRDAVNEYVADYRERAVFPK